MDILGGRVRASDGAVLDGSGFVIAGKSDVVERSAAVTFDGTNFFVVWSDPTAGILGTRVRPTDRALLDSPPTTLSSPMTVRTSVAFSGTHLLAVWDQGGALMGRRVNPATGAAVEASPVTMLAGIAASNAPINPAVAHDGTGFAVTWRGLGAGGGFEGRPHLHLTMLLLALIGGRRTLGRQRQQAR